MLDALFVLGILQVHKLRCVKKENIEIMCFIFQIEFNV